MFDKMKWKLLQLFADGGASAGEGSGAASDSGDASAAAGQRLLELGVPKDRIRTNRAKQASTLPEGAYRTQQQMEKPNEQAAAAEAEKPKTEPQPSRMAWEEIVKDPEYNQKIQDIVKARVKDDGKSKAILRTLEPALTALAKEHGLDPANMDYETLAKSITGEYDRKALEMGVSKEVAMMLDSQQRTLEQQKTENHIRKLESQSEAMKGVFPKFDLRVELQNPMFARLTSPNIGMSVEDAFYAVHRKELQAASAQVAAEQTAKMISNAIQSGSRRPDEAGSQAQAASVTTFDYRKASPAQRNELKARIRAAAARGEKIYPGR